MVRRMIVIGAATGSLLFSVCAAISLASATNVTQAIKAEDKITHSSPAYPELTHFDVKTVAQARRLIPQLEVLGWFLDRAANVVASASATSRQRKGQQDWVAGVRTAARAVEAAAAVLKEVVDGKKVAASAELSKAAKQELSASRQVIEGDRLLGLPSSD
jgi:hypothetical protein